MMLFDLPSVMKKLAETRLAFCSEADFQHALAWTIHQLYPDTELFLEYPFRPQIENHEKPDVYYLDILMTNPCFGKIAVELKYKTKKAEVLLTQEKKEKAMLRNQGAQDLARYDFIKDIVRLEKAAEICKQGFAVFLTNDDAYWNKPGRDNQIDTLFRIHEGRTLGPGTLSWNQNAGSGTTKGRQESLDLKGSYDAKWQPYPTQNEKENGFKLLILEINA